MTSHLPKLKKPTLSVEDQASQQLGQVRSG